MDGKATSNIGAFSRGGDTRGDHKASDHDLGCKEKYIPCGIVDEDTAQLYVTFGRSFKTSDCIVDTLAAWWQGLSATEHGEIDRVQIKMDNGSESSGVRPQFLHRMVPFADTIGKPLHLLYDPPYHSKYNPIERRLFSQISRNWAAEPLINYDKILGLIRNTTTTTGLKVRAYLDTKEYPLKVKPTAQRLSELHITRHRILPKWNYTIAPSAPFNVK